MDITLRMAKYYEETNKLANRSLEKKMSFESQYLQLMWGTKGKSAAPAQGVYIGLALKLILKIKYKLKSPR